MWESYRPSARSSALGATLTRSFGPHGPRSATVGSSNSRFTSIGTYGAPGPQVSGWLTSRTTGANRAASAASSVDEAAAVETDANGTTITAASAARRIQ